VAGLVDLPDAAGPRPTIVICHGFKGFMEWGFFPVTATLLATRGFSVVRFNLSGTGMRPGDELVTDPAAFRDNTHSRELEEVLAVLAAVGGEIAAGRVDRSRLGLLGHSRGGGNAILAAAEPAWRDEIRALVTWASIARVDRYSDEHKEVWRRTGELPVTNARTGQRLSLGLPLLADLEENASRLDIRAAAGKGKSPWLIVHGEEDESVPVDEARQLATAAVNAHRQHEVLLLPGAQHTFGCRHPFVGPTRDLIAALNATQTWFLRHLE
jgi:uncharacterized protein